MTGNKQPIFWLSGNYYEVNKKWDAIKGMLSDPNVVTLHCGFNSVSSIEKAASATDVILSLKMRDMFDTRPRIIKMKGLPENYSAITEYLTLVNNDNVLVIDSPVGYWAPPSYKRFSSVAASTFYKTIKSKGYIFDFKIEPKRSVALTALKSMFKDAKREVVQEALTLLIDTKGANIDLLYSEVGKLISYKPRGKITIEDIEDCCVPLFLRTVWNLIDSVDNGYADRALRHLHEFYEHAEGDSLDPLSSFKGQTEELFGALVHHYVFVVCLSGSKKLSVNDVCKAVDGLFKRSKKSKAKQEMSIEEKSKRRYLDPDSELFNNKFVGMNVNKVSIGRAHKWGKRKTYNVLLDLLESREICRLSKTVVGIKLCLDSFVLSACDKISFEKSRMIKPAL